MLITIRKEIVKKFKVDNRINAKVVLESQVISKTPRIQDLIRKLTADSE